MLDFFELGGSWQNFIKGFLQRDLGLYIFAFMLKGNTLTSFIFENA